MLAKSLVGIRKRPTLWIESRILGRGTRIPVQCLTKHSASSSKVSHYFRFLQLATAQQFVRLTRRQLTPFFYDAPFLCWPFGCGSWPGYGYGCGWVWGRGRGIGMCRVEEQLVPEWNASVAECNRTMATCQQRKRENMDQGFASVNQQGRQSGSLSRKH